MMNWQVLGCSGSVTPEDRSSSYVLGDHTLFDAGCVASALELDRQRAIRRIFLSHAHLDHIKDLVFLGENVFSSSKSLHEQEPIDLIGSAAVLEAVRKHLMNGILWPDFTILPSLDKPLFRYQVIKPGEVIQCDNMSVEAIEVNHDGPALGYVILGADGGLVYSGDTGPTDEIWQRVHDHIQVSHVVIETSFPNRLHGLALQARHLTVAMLQDELKKLPDRPLQIGICHIKKPYREETLAELRALDDPRLTILAAGDLIEF